MVVATLDKKDEKLSTVIQQKQRNIIVRSATARGKKRQCSGTYYGPRVVQLSTGEQHPFLRGLTFCSKLLTSSN